LRQHLRDDVLDEIWRTWITYHFLPPHSSDQTQPLDLCFLLSPKIIFSAFDEVIAKQPNAQKIDRIISGIEAATTTHNILKSFKRAGIETFYENSHLKVRVILQNCDRVRHIFPLQPSQTSTNSIRRVWIKNICEFPDKDFEWGMPQQVSFMEDQSVCRAEPSEALTKPNGLSFSFADIIVKEFPRGFGTIDGKWVQWRRPS
jgi:hypothetical protein